MNGIINTEALKEVTGYKRADDVEKCLDEQGVRYFNGKNGPWTTISLINAAKGLVALSQDQTEDVL